MSALIFLGGSIHAPANYTGLAYRAGRVLQWLSHHGWFWIDTEDYRMNDRACGIEWLSAPLLLFTESTRGLFLLNFLPFLLLPGLIFSVFTRLGVRARVAWHWMWLLPTGYNFILQAGGNANDTFPTVYALAAVDFGLRAVEIAAARGFVAFDAGRRAADRRQGQQPAAAAAVGDCDFSGGSVVAQKTGRDGAGGFAGGGGFVSADGDFECALHRRLVGAVHRARRDGHEKSARRRLGQRAAAAAGQFHAAAVSVRRLVERARAGRAAAFHFRAADREFRAGIFLAGRTADGRLGGDWIWLERAAGGFGGCSQTRPGGQSTPSERRRNPARTE